ncbi:hypothetical protein AMJ49_03420 [Parcubacteria bacterium DG_74_2]|nr:MAG: hypothetical protein AMJ49_03420 [Parcubacteria bacterium DG_74_2]
MTIKTKILIGILVIIFILVVGWYFLEFFQNSGKVLINTDRQEYEIKESLRIKIKNDFRRNICFSSCYPYYLENKDGEWEFYPYGKCLKMDIIENCVKPGQEKTFEIKLEFVNEGSHRISVPVCQGCAIGDLFSENKRFYSNEFTIQEKL